ncbi:peptidylprolyl isomerase [Solihabitans fulvus]|uniref:Peptidyl-prolyl cis-trans isomerase n=1 Tax=Solihabitans fulvus TaxID=1892852 RepID=A0A5B2WQW9_9PSEU|nr:peptidylprolyl isomerase [Solihabitans fulvus]KAA2253905.1 peptidylprolyl isomerase [Solihabitans fulvus]
MRTVSRLLCAAVMAAAVVAPMTAATASAAEPDAVAAAHSATCTYLPDPPAARPVSFPSPHASTRPFREVLLTNFGPIVIDMFADKAPCTTHSIRHLGAQGFYNDTKCHRLTTQRIYVLQCGDPLATGEGGPGYKYDDENLTGATYPAGTVAMANAGPATNGSQFFFVYQDTKLRPNYTPFGRVVFGMDALKRIGAAGTTDGGPDGAPKNPVEIKYVFAIG